MNDLGDRIKSYESGSKTSLLRKTPVILRVDGKAFHTYTRNCVKPFDRYLIESMVRAGERTSKEMQGFILGYHQSDEFSFYISDTQNEKSQAWFDNEIQKLVSITVSLFTAYFNLFYKRDDIVPAVFDCRAFSVPQDDVPNVFVWRQRDWQRNSIQMLSRAYFSHKVLLNKNALEMKDMLSSIGVNWDKLEPHLKHGTFITKDDGRITEKLGYYELEELIKNQSDRKE